MIFDRPSAPRTIQTSALKKKGLRRHYFSSFAGYDDSNVRPEEEGIKTREHGRSRQDTLFKRPP